MKARDYIIPVLLVSAMIVSLHVTHRWAYAIGKQDGQKSSCQELVNDAFRSGKAMGTKKRLEAE